MHAKVNDVFKAHQEWLDKGGSQAILAVQNANLVAMMDRALNECEAEAYQRGSGDGYRIGRAQGWAGAVQANTLSGSGVVPFPTPESWDAHAQAAARKALEQVGTVNTDSFDAGGAIRKNLEKRTEREIEDALDQKEQAFRAEVDAELNRED